MRWAPADVGDKPESYLQGVEVIFAALFPSELDAGGPMTPETRKAFNQLWSLLSHIAVLTAFLRTPSPPRRPLHERLALLWAASKQRELLSSAERQSLVAEAFRKQQSDGGWTNESLGPWMPHPEAQAASGSSSYATAFTTYVLQRGGVRPSDPRLARALLWLTSHQDHETGAWRAHSMNKRYSVGSMQSFFMQDAATAFASLALIEAGR